MSGANISRYLQAIKTAIAELDTTYVKLDQTVSQSVINGILGFNKGVHIDTDGIIDFGDTIGDSRMNVYFTRSFGYNAFFLESNVATDIVFNLNSAKFRIWENSNQELVFFDSNPFALTQYYQLCKYADTINGSNFDITAHHVILRPEAIVGYDFDTTAHFSAYWGETQLYLIDFGPTTETYISACAGTFYTTATYVPSNQASSVCFGVIASSYSDMGLNGYASHEGLRAQSLGSANANYALSCFVSGANANWGFYNWNTADNFMGGTISKSYFRDTLSYIWSSTSNKLDLNSGTINLNGTVKCSGGASGSFTTVDLKTVTVTNGIITSII